MSSGVGRRVNLEATCSEAGIGFVGILAGQFSNVQVLISSVRQVAGTSHGAQGVKLWIFKLPILDVSAFEFLPSALTGPRPS